MKRRQQGAFQVADIAQVLAKDPRWSEVAVDDVIGRRFHRCLEEKCVTAKHLEIDGRLAVSENIHRSQQMQRPSPAPLQDDFCGNQRAFLAAGGNVEILRPAR